MSLHVQREPWMRDAACRDSHPDLFFPEGPGVSNGTIGTAKKICAGCPVTTECLNYALDHHIHDGVWGGMSVRERRDHRKRNAA